MPLFIVSDDIDTLTADVVVRAGGSDGPARRPRGHGRFGFVRRSTGPAVTASVAAERDRTDRLDALQAAYRTALTEAVALGAGSVAVSLPDGESGPPPDLAFSAALTVIRELLADHDLAVWLSVPDRAAVLRSRPGLADLDTTPGSSQPAPAPPSVPETAAPPRVASSRARSTPVEVDPLPATGRRVRRSLPSPAPASLPEATSTAPEAPLALAGEHEALAAQPPAPASAVSPSTVLGRQPRALPKAPPDLADVLERLDEPFSTTVLRLIDARALTDVQVYRRANLDRRLFSKLRSSAAYTPSKKTALALAVALELDLAETAALLARAGYTLSSALRFDAIVAYFIDRGVHDVFTINEALFYFDQPLLGT